jgi:hypothetical protein
VQTTEALVKLVWTQGVEEHEEHWYGEVRESQVERLMIRLDVAFRLTLDHHVIVMFGSDAIAFWCQSGNVCN